MSEMESMMPATGNVIGADGKVYNLVSLLGGGEPVDGRVFDVSAYAPRFGLLIGADGRVYDIVQLIQSGGGGGDLTEYVKKTDYATTTTPGVIKTSSAVRVDSTGTLVLGIPTEGELRAGAYNQKPLSPANQHAAAFYGLAKAAGADMKDDKNTVGDYPEAAQKAIRNMISAESSSFSLLTKMETTEDGVTISADFAACKEIYAHVYVPRSEQNTEAKTMAVKLNDSGYVIGYMFGLKHQYSNMFNFRIRAISDDRAVYSSSYAVDTTEFGNWYAGSSAMAVEKMITVNVAGGITRFTFEGEGKSFVLPKGTKLEIYGR